MLITIIGRGHSGTRSISHTLSASGVFMGDPLNESGDLLPPQDMYEACNEFAQYVTYEGNMKWDFSRVLAMEPTERFKSLINSYLRTVLESKAEVKGWKIPETTLCYPWIVKMFPDAYYIQWVRDPRDCIINGHITDDLVRFKIRDKNSGNIRYDRAVSWKYQREIVRAQPTPRHSISIRFEDMVFSQDETLRRLEEYLGIPMSKIEMRPGSVGRYKTDDGEHMFDFFAEDMREFGYEFE